MKIILRFLIILMIIISINIPFFINNTLWVKWPFFTFPDAAEIKWPWIIIITMVDSDPEISVPSLGLLARLHLGLRLLRQASLLCQEPPSSGRLPHGKMVVLPGKWRCYHGKTWKNGGLPWKKTKNAGLKKGKYVCPWKMVV